ncbi:UNVERIFIED_CONTAM: hypothetical protein Slati_1268100 [Sesamum latifolium]|uniref:Methyltransferase-related protein n=1 Tax=Sesamum latifolium TaxID=2727402 RepID=A0AAW2XGX0_9LAMI
MCPLRFILVFFSAVLAGYFAWKTVATSPKADSTTSDQEENTSTSTIEKQQLHFLKSVENGFWVLIDMASGRYLWRNIKQFKTTS